MRIVKIFGCRKIKQITFISPPKPKNLPKTHLFIVRQFIALSPIPNPAQYYNNMEQEEKNSENNNII